MTIDVRKHLAGWIAAIALLATGVGGAVSCSSNNSSNLSNGDDASVDGANGACPYDTQTNRWHCGDCNTACKVGEVCSQGECKNACDAPLVKCPGVEDCVDLTNNLEHCGGCDNNCIPPAGGAPPIQDAGPDGPSDPGQRVATAVCANGACGYTCPSGSTSCDDGGCFDLKVNVSNCGSCDNSCGSSAFCNAGVCCTSGQIICGTKCITPTTDIDNCGKCNVKCPAQSTCVQGNCKCQQFGYQICSGTCINTSSDPKNCGSCGTACTVNGQACINSSCQCPQGKTDVCNNTCTNKQTDGQNCGTCGHVCNTYVNEQCVGGNCAGCTGQFPDICSNTCVNKQNDPNNCGNCGTVCPNNTPNCYQGSCVNGIIYDEQFTGMATYTQGMQQYDNWKTYLQSLSGNSYVSITMSGSLDQTGITCNTPASVVQITQALHNGTVANVSCNGHTWYVGTCGQGIELSIDASYCSCANPGHSLRPMYGSSYYWGGVNSNTCPPPTQEQKLFVQ